MEDFLEEFFERVLTEISDGIPEENSQMNGRFKKNPCIPESFFEEIIGEIFVALEKFLHGFLKIDEGSFEKVVLKDSLEKFLKKYLEQFLEEHMNTFLI